MTDFQFRVIASDKEMQDAFSVRDIVFIQEQKVPIDIEMDEFDKSATHFIVYDQTKPIATARIRAHHYNDTAKVERVAVLKEYRKLGVGRELMLFLEGEAAKMGYTTFKLNSQRHAEDFYSKLGYIPTGEPFYEANIEHIAMEKRMKAL